MREEACPGNGTIFIFIHLIHFLIQTKWISGVKYEKKCFVSNFFPSSLKQTNKTPQFVTSNEIYWEDEITDLMEDFGTEGLSPREGKTREAPSTSRRKWLKVQDRLSQNLEETKTSLCLLVRPSFPMQVPQKDIFRIRPTCCFKTTSPWFVTDSQSFRVLDMDQITNAGLGRSTETICWQEALCVQHISCLLRHHSHLAWMLSCFSHVLFCVTPWTVAYQYLSMGVSR